MILTESEITKFAEVISEIDGGCGGCINRFMQNLKSKEILSDETFKELCSKIIVYGEPFEFEE